MWVGLEDYNAFRACVKNDAVEIAQLLLDQGMNFSQYQSWAEQYHLSGHEETLAALAEHWSAIQEKKPSVTPEQGE